MKQRFINPGGSTPLELQPRLRHSSNHKIRNKQPCSSERTEKVYDGKSQFLSQVPSLSITVDPSQQILRRGREYQLSSFTLLKKKIPEPKPKIKREGGRVW
ncbi:hypothetical protein NPIL_74301 [Nephila pilipes]|uniref:Uncharacterized protein n=1 Tax=Nephila pilipes TaxID=299642 RepID=A0A8X6U809_NEPPI|nr:hypothetical protein NPIL_74301 [Nephila pilipes]